MLLVDIEKSLGAFRLRAQLRAEGEMLALLGASGSGKSMTLQCIAGIERPDRGHIELDGRVLFDSEKKIDLPPQQRHVGYLFQNYALFPNMTVRENVACCVRNRKERQAQTDALLRRFRLTGLEDRHPRQLSGGEQQRTALARIFASKPSVILLDEPLSALDEFLRRELAQQIFDLLSDFDGSVIWVTHDAQEALSVCKNVCVLENGQSSGIFPTQTLFSDPQTAAQARLAGLRNLYRCENGFLPELGLHLPFGNGTVCIPPEAVIPGGDLHCVCIRTANGNALLRPVGLSDAPPLYTGLPAERGQTLSVCIEPSLLRFFPDA